MNPQIIKEDHNNREAFDNIVHLASHICDTPAALINFLDDKEQWTSFSKGWPKKTIPKEESICQLTVKNKGLLYISDTSKDPRIDKIKAVKNDPNINFYAGISFKGLNDSFEATLCVIDNKPRKLTKVQKNALKTLASELESRLELLRSKQNIALKNKRLNKTARFLNNSADIMLILNPESLVIEEVHAEVYEKLGFSADELEGSPISNYCTHSDFVVKLNDWIKSRKTEKFSSEIRMKLKTGPPVYMHLQVSYNDGLLYLTGRDISKRKKAEQQLRGEKKLSDGIIENLPGIFCLIDENGIIRKWNKNLESVTGYSADEVNHSSVEKLITYDSFQVAYQKLKEIFEHHSARTEITIVTKNGRKVPFLLSGFRQTIERETYAVIIGINISDEKKTLKEKETLLAEIHHRVKNNLAIISGLLQLEADNSKDNRELSSLKKSVMRIQSMALIHENLYSSEDFSNISFDEYIGDLVASIKTHHRKKDRDIQVRTRVEDISLSINQAMPCALILNELLTNAFKHAFPDRKEGLIEINMKKSGTDVQLHVKDNGTGIRENQHPDQNSSLGFTLLEVLCKQLKAEYRLKNQTGTSIHIRFPLQYGKRGASGNMLVNGRKRK